MDEHFREGADAASNLPLLMGLIGIWHRNMLQLSGPRHHSL